MNFAFLLTKSLSFLQAFLISYSFLFRLLCTTMSSRILLKRSFVFLGGQDARGLLKRSFVFVVEALLTMNWMTSALLPILAADQHREGFVLGSSTRWHVLTFPEPSELLTHPSCRSYKASNNLSFSSASARVSALVVSSAVCGEISPSESHFPSVFTVPQSLFLLCPRFSLSSTVSLPRTFFMSTQNLASTDIFCATPRFHQRKSGYRVYRLSRTLSKVQDASKGCKTVIVIIIFVSFPRISGVSGLRMRGEEGEGEERAARREEGGETTS